MPRGPKGEKRPADVIGAAVMVATREIEETTPPMVGEFEADYGPIPSDEIQKSDPKMEALFARSSIRVTRSTFSGAKNTSLPPSMSGPKAP